MNKTKRKLSVKIYFAVVYFYFILAARVKATTDDKPETEKLQLDEYIDLDIPEFYGKRAISELTLEELQLAIQNIEHKLNVLYSAHLPETSDQATTADTKGSPIEDPSLPGDEANSSKQDDFLKTEGLSSSKPSEDNLSSTKTADLDAPYPEEQFDNAALEEKPESTVDDSAVKENENSLTEKDLSMDDPLTEGTNSFIVDEPASEKDSTVFDPEEGSKSKDSTEKLSEVSKSSLDEVNDNAQEGLNQSEPKPVTTDEFTQSDPLLSNESINQSEPKPVTTDELIQSDPITSDETTESDPIASDEATDSDSVTSDETTESDPVKTDEFTQSEPPLPNETTQTDPLLSNESINQPEPDPVTSDEFTQSESKPVTTDELIQSDPITSDETTDSDLVTSDETTDSDPVTSDEFTQSESKPVTTDELIQSDPITSDETTDSDLVTSDDSISESEPDPVTSADSISESESDPVTSDDSISESEPDPVTTDEITEPDPVTPNESINQFESKPITTDEFTQTDPLLSNETTQPDPVTSNESINQPESKPVTTDEFTQPDPLLPNETTQSDPLLPNESTNQFESKPVTSDETTQPDPLLPNESINQLESKPVTSDEFTQSDPVTSGETTESDPVTSNETTESDPVTTDEFTDSDPVTTDELTDSDPVTSNETTDSDLVTSGETTDSEPVTSNETTDSDLVTSDETTDSDLVTTDEFTDSDPVTSNETTDSDLVTSGETTDSDLVTSGETTDSDLVTSDETTDSDLVTSDDSISESESDPVTSDDSISESESDPVTTDEITEPDPVTPNESINQLEDTPANLKNEAEEKQVNSAVDGDLVDNKPIDGDAEVKKSSLESPSSSTKKNSPPAIDASENNTEQNDSSSGKLNLVNNTQCVSSSNLHIWSLSSLAEKDIQKDVNCSDKVCASENERIVDFLLKHNPHIFTSIPETLSDELLSECASRVVSLTVLLDKYSDGDLSNAYNWRMFKNLVGFEVVGGGINSSPDESIYDVLACLTSIFSSFDKEKHVVVLSNMSITSVVLGGIQLMKPNQLAFNETSYSADNTDISLDNLVVSLLPDLNHLIFSGFEMSGWTCDQDQAENTAGDNFLSMATVENCSSQQVQDLLCYTFFKSAKTHVLKNNGISDLKIYTETPFLYVRHLVLIDEPGFTNLVFAHVSKLLSIDSICIVGGSLSLSIDAEILNPSEAKLQEIGIDSQCKLSILGDIDSEWISKLTLSEYVYSPGKVAERVFRIGVDKALKTSFLSIDKSSLFLTYKDEFSHAPILSSAQTSHPILANLILNPKDPSIEKESTDSIQAKAAAMYKTIGLTVSFTNESLFPCPAI
ncbi:hypothetical protein NEAUS06_1547 [Nematocida ausubeli]|nr:hypothetical protein NEAUS06_1547 [Nematocida ausubeli]